MAYFFASSFLLQIRNIFFDRLLKIGRLEIEIERMLTKVTSHKHHVIYSWFIFHQHIVEIPFSTKLHQKKFNMRSGHNSTNNIQQEHVYIPKSESNSNKNFSFHCHKALFHRKHFVRNILLKSVLRNVWVQILVVTKNFAKFLISNFPSKIYNKAKCVKVCNRNSILLSERYGIMWEHVI